MTIALIILFFKSNVKRSARRRLAPKISLGCLLLILAITSGTNRISDAARISGPTQNDGLADAEFRMATGYYQRSLWRESGAAFEEFLLRHADDDRASDAMFFLAESQAQNEDFSDAFVTFQKFLKSNPDHQFSPRAKFRLGEAAYQLGKNQIAISSLETFIRENPKHQLVEFALTSIGEIRLQSAEPRLAQQAFEMALRLYPNSELADQNRYGLAQSFQLQNKLRPALRFYRYLAKDKYSDYSALAKLRLGIVEMEAGDEDAAKTLLSEASENLPGDGASLFEARYWLARIALEQDEHQRAHDIFLQLDSLPADENLGSGICFDAAVAAYKSGHADLAVEWLAKLRATWPTNRLAAQALALEIDLIRQNGNDDVVLDYCKQFVSRFPDSPLRFNVSEIAGRIQYRQARYRECADTFADLLAASNQPTDDQLEIPQQQRSNWHYQKGLALIELNEFEAALDDLRTARSMLLDTENSNQIKLAIASALYGQQLYADAAAEFESWLEDAEDRDNVMATLSRMIVCYGHLGQWEDAESATNVLTEGDETQGLEAWQFLADHAFEKKRFDLATTYYQTLARPKNDAKFKNHGLAGLSWLMMETTTEEATELFLRLVAEYPDSQFSSQAAISRAKFLEEQNDLAAATLLYQRVIERFPNFELAQIARLRLAYSGQQVGEPESLRRSQSLIEQFLQIADASEDQLNDDGSRKKSQQLVDEAIYQLAWIKRDLNKPEQSLESFEKLVNDFPNSKYWPDAAYRVAAEAVQNRNFVFASDLIDTIVKRDSVPSEIKIQTLYLQSRIAAGNDDWEAVIEPMRTLIASTEDAKLKATAEYWLAEALYRKSDFEAAGSLLDQLQPDAKLLGESLEPWLLLRLAQCHGKSQRWTNAALIARDCLDRFADFSNAHEFSFVLGRAAEYDGMFQQARLHFTQVVESIDGAGTETAAISQWRIGESFFHQQNYKDAIAAYFKVDSLYKFPRWQSAALIQGGKCQEHLENWQRAAKLYTQLIENYPNSEFAADAKQRLNRVTQLAENVSLDGTKTR